MQEENATQILKAPQLWPLLLQGVFREVAGTPVAVGPIGKKGFE
jgi:hypothetical protein